MILTVGSTDSENNIDRASVGSNLTLVLIATLIILFIFVMAVIIWCSCEQKKKTRQRSVKRKRRESRDNSRAERTISDNTENTRGFIPNNSSVRKISSDQTHEHVNIMVISTAIKTEYKIILRALLVRQIKVVLMRIATEAFQQHHVRRTDRD